MIQRATVGWVEPALPNSTSPSVCCRLTQPTATSLEMRVQWLNRLDIHRQTVRVSKGLADSAVLQLRQEERY